MKTDVNLFKNHQLPLARIKKIMKSDEDVRVSICLIADDLVLNPCPFRKSLWSIHRGADLSRLGFYAWVKEKNPSGTLLI
jgi:hypothetical protein